MSLSFTPPLLRLVIWPEFDIAILSQTASLDKLTLLLHNVLNRDAFFVPEDPQMVTDDVSVPALRARNKRRASVVSLLGNVVVAAVPARHAGEGELVVCCFLAFGEGRPRGFGG